MDKDESAYSSISMVDQTYLLPQKRRLNRYSLSLKRNKTLSKVNAEPTKDKENFLSPQNETQCIQSAFTTENKDTFKHDTEVVDNEVQDLQNLKLSDVVTVNTEIDSLYDTKLDLNNPGEFENSFNRPLNDCNNGGDRTINTRNPSSFDGQSLACEVIDENKSIISLSSATEFGNQDNTSDCLDDTVIYEKPSYSLSFAVTDCNNVNVTSTNVNIKKNIISHAKSDTNIDCEIIENSQEAQSDKSIKLSPAKKQAMSVNIEIKKKDTSISEDCQSKVLILNTNAIEKLSHVIIQPPLYKSFRRKVQGKRKIVSGKDKKFVVKSSRKNGNGSADCLRQNSIEAYFKKAKESSAGRSLGEVRRTELRNDLENCENDGLVQDDMSKTVKADTARSDGIGRVSCRSNREENVLCKLPYRDQMFLIRQDHKNFDGASPKQKTGSASSCAPRRNVDSLHFSLPSKTKTIKTKFSPRDIPCHKIVAGTHFAVDAFCYGEIPSVKNYFLTHFHSDHYTGLKKSFSKILYCSKITADLCISRLNVNSKCIHVLNLDETVTVEGVEVTAIDANHCPGAVMLIFSLPNGKTLLHTGDFRATPTMESHPVFWNNDIHTIYLDTTYCNPRYDFPNQDQSLEMAVHVLRQKKMALEKAKKDFKSVLIVCGTYTIGKEKFFLGLAKRVGCSVWACPEKDKVLQTVEGRSFSHGSAQSCQLHVVPMRDLTHEKLRSYLDSLQGAFSEVVAFKPSGWENGKSVPVTKDMVTIHGVPYSEHSSFSEMIRFVKYLKPKQVVPTVDISGGIKAVQKYFPCPLVYKEETQCQSKISEFFKVQNRQQVIAGS